MSAGEERRALLGVIALAFFLRLALALLWRPSMVGDATDYVRLADGLAAGAGYVDGLGRATAWRPPGYPAVSYTHLTLPTKA